MLIPQEYPIHSVAFLSPDKTTEEQAQLVEDIGLHGQLVSILRWRGQVIDGRHRLAACLEIGVEPRFEDVDDGAHPGELFLSLVGRQRKMTVSQLAALAVEIARWSTRGRPRAGEEDDPDLRVITQEEAARMLGISRSQVTQARRVFSEESPAVDELRRAVINGLVTINAAAAAAKNPPEVQRAALEMVTGGKARSLSAALRQVNNEIALREDAEALMVNRAQPLGDAVTLHAASAGDMKNLVEPASIDLVITHPPHTEEFLPGFPDLADFAVHALRDSGMLVAVVSPMFLPDILRLLEHDELRWFGALSLVFHGRPINSGRPHFMRLQQLTALIYGKAQAKLDGMDNLLMAPPEELSQGRTEHEAVMALLLERFARPGQAVCDPVMRDRAGTALAARGLGCPFIGAERISSCLARIWKRLEEAEGNEADHDGSGPEVQEEAGERQLSPPGVGPGDGGAPPLPNPDQPDEGAIPGDEV